MPGPKGSMAANRWRPLRQFRCSRCGNRYFRSRFLHLCNSCAVKYAPNRKQR